MKYVYNKKSDYMAEIFDDITDDEIKKVYGNDIIITTIKYKAPILKKGVLEESANKYLTVEIAENKILDITNGKIKDLYTNQLIVPYDENILLNKDFYNIVENKLVFDNDRYNAYMLDVEHKELETKREQLLEKTKELEKIEKEKPFIFKEHLQPNRELEDQTSLLKIISFMNISKKNVFDEWKMKDEDGHEHYISLTLQEMIQLGVMMQEQTTRTMKKYSEIRENIKIMSYDELKDYEL